jgi:HEPN domain-containing protein
MPERIEPGSPAHWLEYALSDLALAKSAPPEHVLYDSLCFHAQQAAEKALKAVLVKFGVPPMRTHNIGELLEEASKVANVPADLSEATMLTDYAVSGRYPDDVELIKQKEWNYSVGVAERVFIWAVSIIDT